MGDGRGSRKKSLRSFVLDALVALGEPAGSRDILGYFQSLGYPTLAGKTPRASIQAAVWKDIKANGPRSPFKMLGHGRVHRKFWLSEATIEASKLRPTGKKVPRPKY
jgi:hypothetical protein